MLPECFQYSLDSVEKVSAGIFFHRARFLSPGKKGTYLYKDDNWTLGGCERETIVIESAWILDIGKR